MAVIHLAPGDVIIISEGLVLTVASAADIVSEPEIPEPTKEDIDQQLKVSRSWRDAAQHRRD